MYHKDLDCSFRLRLSQTDMEYLINLSNERKQSVSECLRYIIGDYRRKMSNGDTKTDFNNFLQ